MAYLTGIFFNLAACFSLLVIGMIKNDFKGKAADFVAWVMVLGVLGFICCMGYWITFLLLKL